MVQVAVAPRSNKKAPRFRGAALSTKNKTCCMRAIDTITQQRIICYSVYFFINSK